MNSSSTILIVDVDAEIREIVHVLLESEDFRTMEASSGEEALRLFSNDIDLVILDIMMEGLSGYKTCAELRKISNVPILFLTAKNQDSDLSMGYAVGGDDYLSKPFSYTELLSRVKGLLRRYHTYQGKTQTTSSSSIEYAGITLDPDRNFVTKNEKSLNLTETEYQILKLLLQHPGKIFSAELLYEQVWKEPFLYISSNTIMVHIRRIREKIEDDPQNPALLKTVWGKGYRIE